VQHSLTLMIVLILLTAMLEGFFHLLTLAGTTLLFGDFGFVLIERPR